MKQPPNQSRRIAVTGAALAGLAILSAVPWYLSYRENSKAGLSGTWTVRKPVLGVKMQYTLKPDGTYLALLGEMDHQGTYSYHDGNITFHPNVVAQRGASQFLKEQAKNPDGLDPAELRFIEQLAKPYSMSVSKEKELNGLGLVAKLDPKAAPLF